MEMIRAKGEKNKRIRFQEIMDVTDQLFQTNNYHEIGLTEIAKEMNMVRSGLYKYVASKEEIFLEIYLQKQSHTIDLIFEKLEGQLINQDILKEAIVYGFKENFDHIKYHQILNAIIETNVSVEKLADFKIKNNRMIERLLIIMQNTLHLPNKEAAFDLYLSILYHCVYLYDRVVNHQKYLEAMKLADLPVIPLDFTKALTDYIHMNFQYYSK